MQNLNYLILALLCGGLHINSMATAVIIITTLSWLLKIRPVM